MRYSYDSLAVWCRAVRHGHGAGLTMVKVMQMQAKSGPAMMRTAASRIAHQMESGASLEDALLAEGETFPKMFVAMAGVGERTGRLPEVFGHMEGYFSHMHRLRREFWSRAMWPIVQFVGGVLVIAFTILISGFLASGAAPEPIGFGLSGASGAILFLIVVGSVVGGGIFAFRLVTKSLAKQAAFEAFLLRAPIVGPSVHAVAMSRFCLGLQLTLDSNMSIDRAVRQSLRATGNGAFMAEADLICKRLKKGDELADALGRNRVFTPEFLGAIGVGEVSGQLPEVMGRQAEHYREEASRQLTRATRTLNVLIYLGVGLFMIIMIFRLFGTYSAALSH